MKIVNLICVFAFLSISVSFCDENSLPSIVEEFRDDPTFYHRLRGVKTDIVKPDRSNIDSLISDWDNVYANHLRQLYSGFIAELEEDFDSAEFYYKNSLTAPVIEECNYYSNIDLARVYLKKGEYKEAHEYLQIYVDSLEIELTAVNLHPFERPCIYSVATEGTESMLEVKNDKSFLFKVLTELKKQLGISFAEEFKNDPAYYFYRYGIKAGFRRPSIGVVNGISVLYPGPDSNYLAELFWGYICEQENKYSEAETHFRNCLKKEVAGEDYFYTYFDLARVALKDGRRADAKKYAEIYISKLAELIGTSAKDGYRLVLLKEEYLKLRLVLNEL